MFVTYFECTTQNQECKIFKSKSDTKAKISTCQQLFPPFYNAKFQISRSVPLQGLHYLMVRFKN